MLSTRSVPPFPYQSSFYIVCNPNVSLIYCWVLTRRQCRFKNALLILGRHKLVAITNFENILHVPQPVLPGNDFRDIRHGHRIHFPRAVDSIMGQATGKFAHHGSSSKRLAYWAMTVFSSPFAPFTGQGKDVAQVGGRHGWPPGADHLFRHPEKLERLMMRTCLGNGKSSQKLV